MKVAIVHDWLIGGGAEKVVLELHNMFPEAPIYTSFATNEWRTKLSGKVVTGYLQSLGKIRKFIPYLRAWWFSHLNLSEYDLVISSSGAEAKFIKVKPSTIHIAYIHAPTHYYWARYETYLKEPGFGAFNWLAKIGLKLLVGPLRKIDYKAAQQPNYLIANSGFTSQEIKKYYGRDSVIIHPPVDTERFSKGSAIKRSGFVTAGRQTPYKRTDLAVAACSQSNLDLIVIGNGPDHDKLIKMAGPTIKFITRVSDEQIVDYFTAAKAFIFPGLDDFGITPVEALAAGTPVIAYKAGGALDYVVPGETGLFFEEQNAASLAEALNNFDLSRFDSEVIKSSAQKFSQPRFKKEFEAFLKKNLPEVYN